MELLAMAAGDSLKFWVTYEPNVTRAKQMRRKIKSQKVFYSIRWRISSCSQILLSLVHYENDEGNRLARSVSSLINLSSATHCPASQPCPLAFSRAAASLQDRLGWTSQRTAVVVAELLVPHLEDNSTLRLKTGRLDIRRQFYGRTRRMRPVNVQKKDIHTKVLQELHPKSI